MLPREGVLLRVIACLVVSSSPVFADVERALDHEVALGGGQSTLGSQAVAHAKVGASLVHAPDVENRALSCEGDETLGRLCAWFYTGSNPRVSDEVGVEAEGDAWMANDHADGIGTAHAWAHGAEWEFDERVALQPVGDLRDRIWLSGRGVVEARTRFAVPPMFALGNADYRFSAFPMSLEFMTRWRDGKRDPGFSDTFGVSGFRFESKHVGVGILDAKIWEQRVDQFTEGEHTYGISAYGADADLFQLDLFAGGFALKSRIGVTSQTPVYHSVSPATETSKPARWIDATNYAVDATYHDGELDAGLGIGSWLRLGLDAEAIDYGHLAHASLGLAIGQAHLALRGEGGYLDRVGGSPFAPKPPRTRAMMGRVEGEVSWPAANHLDMVVRAWSERSDRDDPRFGTVPMGVATHLGGDLTVRLH